MTIVMFECMNGWIGLAPSILNGAGMNCNMNSRLFHCLQVSFVCVLLPPVAPTAMISSTSYATIEPMDVTFMCTATGVPSPTISWFRIEDGNQTNLTLDSRVAVSPMSTQNPTTLIFEVVQSLTLSDTMGSDTGNYSCQAVNAAGQITVPFQLAISGEVVNLKRK